MDGILNVGGDTSGKSSEVRQGYELSPREATNSAEMTTSKPDSPTGYNRLGFALNDLTTRLHTAIPDTQRLAPV